MHSSEGHLHGNPQYLGKAVRCREQLDHTHVPALHACLCQAVGPSVPVPLIGLNHSSN